MSGIIIGASGKANRVMGLEVMPTRRRGKCFFKDVVLPIEGTYYCL